MLSDPIIDPTPLLLLVLALSTGILLIWPSRSTCLRRRRVSRRRQPDAPPTRNRKKAQWVRDEVIRLKALDPHGSCWVIAATFCALHAGTESVSKTWVATVLRDEKHRVEIVRREIRRRKPRVVPRNRLWALDLTGVPSDAGTTMALGILDYGTRACIALRALESKHSVVLLRELVTAIRRYRKPGAIQTDNEAVFTSRLFRIGLWLLGIRHQRIEKLAPWQNGRIERFFGTFKERWRLYRDGVESVIDDVQVELTTFRAWYNHVRPHMHLDGRVPADVWDGVEQRPGREHAYVSEWEGVLSGFHFR